MPGTKNVTKEMLPRSSIRTPEFRSEFEGGAGDGEPVERDSLLHRPAGEVVQDGRGILGADDDAPLVDGDDSGDVGQRCVAYR